MQTKKIIMSSANWHQVDPEMQQTLGAILDCIDQIVGGYEDSWSTLVVAVCDMSNKIFLKEIQRPGSHEHIVRTDVKQFL